MPEKYAVRNNFLERIRTSCVGVKINVNHAHKMGYWYLSGVPLKNSNDHPHQFYLGVVLGTAGLIG